MISKFDYSKNFLKNDDLLICPICKGRLILNDHSLVCKNKHTYDISKKVLLPLFHIIILKKVKYIIMNYFQIEENLFKKCIIKICIIK